jgi:hypothetical protein
MLLGMVSGKNIIASKMYVILCDKIEFFIIKFASFINLSTSGLNEISINPNSPKQPQMNNKILISIV